MGEWFAWLSFYEVLWNTIPLYFRFSSMRLQAYMYPAFPPVFKHTVKLQGSRSPAPPSPALAPSILIGHRFQSRPIVAQFQSTVGNLDQCLCDYMLWRSALNQLGWPTFTGMPIWIMLDYHHPVPARSYIPSHNGSSSLSTWQYV